MPLSLLFLKKKSMVAIGVVVLYKKGIVLSCRCFGRWLRLAGRSNDLGHAEMLVFAEGSAGFDSDNVTQAAFCVFVVCKVVLVRPNGLSERKESVFHGKSFNHG